MIFFNTVAWRGITIVRNGGPSGLAAWMKGTEMDDAMKNRMVRRAVLAASIPACLAAVALYRVPVHEFLAYLRMPGDTASKSRHESLVLKHAGMFTDNGLLPGSRSEKRGALRHKTSGRRENSSVKSGI